MAQQSGEVRLYTRVTADSWSVFQRYARRGDLYWAERWSKGLGAQPQVPNDMRALYVEGYEDLAERWCESGAVCPVSTIVWDARVPGKSVAAEGLRIRTFVDRYNYQFRRVAARARVVALVGELEHGLARDWADEVVEARRAGEPISGGVLVLAWRGAEWVEVLEKVQELRGGAVGTQ